MKMEWTDSFHSFNSFTQFIHSIHLIHSIHSIYSTLFIHSNKRSNALMRNNTYNNIHNKAVSFNSFYSFNNTYNNSCQIQVTKIGWEFTSSPWLYFSNKRPIHSILSFNSFHSTLSFIHFVQHYHSFHSIIRFNF